MPRTEGTKGVVTRRGDTSQNDTSGEGLASVDQEIRELAEAFEAAH